MNNKFTPPKNNAKWTKKLHYSRKTKIANNLFPFYLIAQNRDHYYFPNCISAATVFCVNQNEMMRLISSSLFSHAHQIFQRNVEIVKHR